MTLFVHRGRERDGRKDREEGRGWCEKECKRERERERLKKRVE